jgi:hypothetical protein
MDSIVPNKILQVGRWKSKPPFHLHHALKGVSMMKRASLNNLLWGLTMKTHHLQKVVSPNTSNYRKTHITDEIEYEHISQNVILIYCNE